ncbi:MAG: hypothetical protein KAR44_08670 [Candidatus Aegiribacteria sp.]|nr:hypothetical protein [Candidatus Aegiribacteria sp.]
MRNILDTYPEFVSYWNKYSQLSLHQKIEGWANEYMSKWPQLLQMQKDDYSDLPDSNWRDIAETRIFPFITDRIGSMSKAHKNLLNEIEPIHTTASVYFCIENLEILYVIYVGIGCGAGWVSTFNESHSVLFGLEMISECQWSDKISIQGLIAHEIGHAVHAVLRDDPGLAQFEGPFWQLYTEGFAQRCEHILLQSDTWHQGQGYNKAGWLSWCKANKRMLAKEFLRSIDINQDTKPFFGSWFDIQGYSQCGYYLGHEVIRDLEKRYSIKEIAVLENVQTEMRAVLETY